ncbi:MAG TPA: hypothetical protein PKB15_07225 [Acidimicrobiia bacterium]|nr:hypothetical protein [Acidimicrobiia bacterium]
MPDSVFFYNPIWIGPGGRLVWSILFTTIGLLWVMMLMKRPAVKTKLAGPGIFVVGIGAGVSMVVAGKTVMENSLTGDTLIPFGFMIAWFSFICGIWAMIMSINFSPLPLPFSRRVHIAGTAAVMVALYVLGGFIHSISILTAWGLALTLIVSISLYIWSLPRRVNDATWAEAIAGALASFVLMTFIYAIIPHEWITFATSYLGFTKDVKLSAGGEFVIQTWLNGNFWTSRTRVLPFELNMEAVQDNATMAIYVITAVINVKLFAAWQKRNEPIAIPASDDSSDSPTKVSRFGRPLRALKTSKA